MPERSLRQFTAIVGKGLRRVRHEVFDSDDLSVLSAFQRLAVDFARFVIVLGRETAGNQIWQSASALTYTTILSIFPLLMVLSSVASIFYTPEEEERLTTWVTQQFTPASPSVLEDLIGNNHFGGFRPTTVEADPLAEDEVPLGEDGEPQEEAEPLPAAEDFNKAIADMSRGFRESAGGLGFVGIVGLFITALLLYKSIERAFESAWETSHASTFTRTVTGFTFLVVIAPIILGLSITISSFVVGILSGDATATTQVANATAAIDGVEAPPETITTPVAPTGLRRYMLMLVPAIFNSLILAAAYIYIPKAQVQWHYALLGGFIAGFLWEAAKLSFFFYIYMSAAQRAMIQSIGVVPIFLIWIYFTWLVFLIGNQIVYVGQNFRRLRQFHFGMKSRTYLDGRLLVAITLLVADAFERGDGGISHDELGMLLRVPPREFDRAMGILMKQGIIELTGDGRYTLRQPADRICVDTLLGLGCDPIGVCVSRGMIDHPAVSRALIGIQDEILQVGRKRTLRDLLSTRRESGTMNKVPPESSPPKSGSPGLLDLPDDEPNEIQTGGRP